MNGYHKLASEAMIPVKQYVRAMRMMVLGILERLLCAEAMVDEKSMNLLHVLPGKISLQYVITKSISNANLYHLETIACIKDLMDKPESFF